MTSQKILLQLCHELSQKTVDPQKIKNLLRHTNIRYTTDPFQLTNEVLKHLHGYQVDSASATKKQKI